MQVTLKFVLKLAWQLERIHAMAKKTTKKKTTKKKTTKKATKKK